MIWLRFMCAINSMHIKRIFCVSVGLFVFVLSFNFKYNMRRVSARQLGSKWEFQCVVLCSWCRQCLRTCEPLHESFRWVDWYHTKSECTNEVLPNCTWISKTIRAGKRDGWYILEEGKNITTPSLPSVPVKKRTQSSWWIASIVSRILSERKARISLTL